MKMRFAVAGLLVALSVFGQPFNPGSNGSDGDLTFAGATAGDVIVFDPKDTKLFPGGLDKDNDNVYHFKTIVIPAGVRVKLRADKLGAAVHWLAQGDVTIDGHLDADGDNGALGGFVPQTFAVPGPGGFYGGGGGDAGSRPATAGFGPQGGRGPVVDTYGCNWYPKGGGISVNDFLVPLVGGSGGGGMFATAPSIGGGGGAGGGALLIASPGIISITSNGRITARGGNLASNSAYGGGGSVRLAANRIQGNGSILTNPLNQHDGRSNGSGGGCGPETGFAGAGGKIRLEAFQQAFNGTVSGILLSGSPHDTYISTTGSSLLKVLTVAGIAVNANPTGSFLLPDVTINSGDNVPLVIETENVPAGTVITLQIFAENGPIQTVNFPALAGAGPKRNATASVKFLTGFSRGFVRATFTR